MAQAQIKNDSLQAFRLGFKAGQWNPFYIGISVGILIASIIELFVAMQ